MPYDKCRDMEHDSDLENNDESENGLWENVYYEEEKPNTEIKRYDSGWTKWKKWYINGHTLIKKIQWHENGEIEYEKLWSTIGNILGAEIRFLEGIKFMVIEYYEKNKPKRKVIFHKNCNKKSVKRYNEKNGIVCEERYFDKNENAELTKKYHENNTLSRITKYHKNRNIKSSNTYFENDLPCSKSEFYKNGNSKFRIAYCNNGKLYRESQYYENGKLALLRIGDKHGGISSEKHYNRN